jgi:hypothetical protein
VHNTFGSFHVLNNNDHCWWHSGPNLASSATCVSILASAWGRMFIFSWTELFPLLWFTYYSWDMKELTEQHRDDCLDTLNLPELVPCEKWCIFF